MNNWKEISVLVAEEELAAHRQPGYFRVGLAWAMACLPRRSVPVFGREQRPAEYHPGAVGLGRAVGEARRLVWCVWGWWGCPTLRPSPRRLCRLLLPPFCPSPVRARSCGALLFALPLVLPC